MVVCHRCRRVRTVVTDTLRSIMLTGGVEVFRISRQRDLTDFENRNRANHRRTMANTAYSDASCVDRHREPEPPFLGPSEAALMRFELKRLPHPIPTAEQSRTAFRAPSCRSAPCPVWSPCRAMFFVGARYGNSTVASAYSGDGDNCSMQLRRRVQTHRREVLDAAYG